MLAEHIAQKGMLKCITVRVWACTLQCSSVGVLVTHFSHLYTGKIRLHPA